MTELPEDKLRYELEERLRFESLLTDISARYINLPVDQINACIEEDQRRICECLDLDLSSLWQWSGDSRRFLTITHLYSIPEGPSRPDEIDAQESFPWTLNKLMNGERLAFSTEDMPPEAAVDIASRGYYGVKSSVNLPLSVGGGPMIGILTFDTVREKRIWPDELVRRLELVAQIFSNAMARKDADRVLNESEARLSLAADAAEAGIWELDCNTNQFWVTERARDIFGYDATETIDLERFEQSVLPGDFPKVREAITRSLERKKPINVEYRILVNEDTIKWIQSSGKPYFNQNGEPDRLLGVSLDITRRKHMEEALRENEKILKNSQKDLRKLAGRLISTKEEELRRLSRELHDDLTQRLAVLAIEAGKLELHFFEECSPPESIQKVSEIKEQLIKISEDVHRISRQLHPTILDDLGLVRAIEAECAALGRRAGIKINFTSQNVPERLPADVPLCLYRIVQEGLNNCICHSGAPICNLILKGSKNKVSLTVKDTGKGFDPDEVREKQGLGLSSIRERVQLVGGNLKIDSQPGQGTSIHVSIPLSGTEK